MKLKESVGKMTNMAQPVHLQGAEAARFSEEGSSFS
jgi:hypothetical protein